MRVASIDIGTNTILLLVAERNSRGDVVAIEERATITRLGQGVDKTRRLAPEAVERAMRCLSAYAEVTAKLAVERVEIVGTSAMRDADGSEPLRQHIRNLFGVDVRVISGDEEAQLTFRGALSGLPPNVGSDVVVFDIGGGSTEIVRGRTTALETSLNYARSFDIGSVRLTERHVGSDPPSSEEIAALRWDIQENLATLPAFPRPLRPIGIAGTMTTLAAVELGLSVYDSEKVHGHILSLAQLEALAFTLAQIPLSARQGLAGMEPKRADVIVAGAFLAVEVLRKLGAVDVMVSDRGVRWGLAEQCLSTSGPSQA
jgi:exopolyphosphatase/guanosine-5'-triphosphate,3'-diphosphate pyrophosphatase